MALWGGSAFMANRRRGRQLASVYRGPRVQRGPTSKDLGTKPPSIYYDPAIDIQGRQLERGWGYAQNDALIGGRRDQEDYETATGLFDRREQRLFGGEGDFTRQRQRLNEDYDLGVSRTNQRYDRSLTDLLTNRSRGGEDYQRNIQGLERNYSRLADRQRQSAFAAGVARGGAMAQAMRKRAENQAWDRQPIDTSYNRFMDDSRLAEGRLGEDRAATLADLLRGRDRGLADLLTGEGRAREDLGTDRAGLERQLLRGREDRELGLQRGGAEYEAGLADLNTIRWAQAQQQGYTDPATVRRPTGGAWDTKPVRFNHRKGQWYYIDRGYHVYPGGRRVRVG